MSFVALLLVGLAMSADAFAAAIGRGVALRSPSLLQAFKIGLVFASVEVITPLIGWMIGRTALPYISAWDHWVAFLLLLGLGVNMVRQAVFCRNEDEDGADAPVAERSGRFDISLILLAFATSIDALAMGVSLSLLSVSIVEAAAVIGCCTLAMATIGVLLGNFLGRCGGRLVEVLGGVLLIGMGFHILMTHI
ncbi:manganese efflux pump MntP [Zymobacter palmae]|uniref:Putative manganese efflux pump MntP n=1 Tax=Zymobacter palmae TaxID=33074 RepID=A0A348HDN3_9GAMM|nr:manganese efflux pump MntP family protein [Zymobacter palmae]BBG29735.1 predicted membrane protein [Zymobacter palmae]